MNPANKKSGVEEKVSYKWLITAIIIAIALSVLISWVVFNYQYTPGKVSTDSGGIVVVQVVPEDQNTGTVKVEIKGDNNSVVN